MHIIVRHILTGSFIYKKGEIDMEKTIQEQLMMTLRRCGHHLHHNVGRDAEPEKVFACLSEDEQKTLNDLLARCLDSWKTE